jgi:hypothetical protein
VPTSQVAAYGVKLRHEVEMIAHSCGVPEPRRLRRFHVRIVQDNGLSVPLNQLFPSPDEADNSPIAAIAAGKAGPRQQPAPPADVRVPGQL